MKQVHSKLLPTLSALALLLFSRGASSASISGHAADTDGTALTKVSICLAQASTPDICERVRWSDKKGNYTFNGLKSGIDYIVAVNGDSSVSNRKFEQRFRTLEREITASGQELEDLDIETLESHWQAAKK